MEVERKVVKAAREKREQEGGFKDSKENRSAEENGENLKRGNYI